MTVLERYRLKSGCPREVPVECWAQMSDAERLAVQTEIARRWYNSVGKYWSDEQSVAMLTGKAVA